MRILFISLLLFIISFGCDRSSPDPEITGIQPNSGPPGAMVTISGNGFSPDAAGNTVSFDGVSAEVTSASESELQTTVPEDAETGPIRVSVGDKTASGPNFIVEALAPGINSVEPDSGVVGTEVTITGMNFSANISDNAVTFNGTSASVTSASETELVTEVPDGATDGPIEITVNQKSTTGPDFDVITTGTVEVMVTTTGEDQDADGYLITADGGNDTDAEANDTIYFSNLEEGNYSLELSGTAGNCSVDGENPRDVSVTAGDTTSTGYTVTCSDVLKNQIAFASNRSGTDNTAFEIYVRDTDGTSAERLTINDDLDSFPSISPDGTRIAYLKIVGGINPNPLRIHIIDADGSNDAELTRNLKEPDDFSISWSPDGDKLAFVSGSGKDGKDQVHVINADGTNQVNISSNDDFNEFISPNAWSPDGSRILVTSTKGSGTDTEIFLIDTNGTGIAGLTNNSSEDLYAAWSPDGSRIAFQSDRDGNDEIYVMNADGTNVFRLTGNSSQDGFPVWSPDGNEIAFVSTRTGNREIFKINADGTGLVINLTLNPANDNTPHWSPVEE